MSRDMVPEPASRADAHLVRHGYGSLAERLRDPAAPTDVDYTPRLVPRGALGLSVRLTPTSGRQLFEALPVAKSHYRAGGGSDGLYVYDLRSRTRVLARWGDWITVWADGRAPEVHDDDEEVARWRAVLTAAREQ